MQKRAWQNGIIADPIRDIQRRVRTHPGTPVVILDLDQSACHHHTRADLAKDAVAHRYHLPELDVLPRPGLYHGAWRDWVRRCGLDQRHPELDWDSIGRQYRAHLSWTEEALFGDDLAEGLKGWLARITGLGARVLAITGRPDWMRDATQRVLTQVGLRIEVHTAIRADPHSSGEEQIPGGKIAQLRQLVALRDVVAFIDDNAANLAEVERHCPNVLPVGFAAPGFLADPGLRAYRCISSFVPQVPQVVEAVIA